MKYFYFSLACLLTFSSVAQKNILQKILKEQGTSFDSILNNPEKYQVQIIYTQINRNAQNEPSFKTFSYGLDTNLYYYPASTVKMPAAFLALEKINDLKIKGLDSNTPFFTGAVSAPQTAVQVDSSAENLLPSVAHYIKKIFAVSDNDAFNRLYEFLGQAYLNQKLWEKGYRSTRIVHRLSVSGYDKEGNRHTNPIVFKKGENILYQQGEVYSSWSTGLCLKKQLRGKGYINTEEKIVNEPFDFTGRNFISLMDLHNMLKAVLFPAAVAPEHRFHLTEADYRFLWECMSILPRESVYPAYSEKDYWDSYVKFLLFGDNKTPMPNNIRIFNKVGNAYGFLTDVAYVVDFENKVEFMLAATIHVNANQIFNDGIYEYDSVGFPFLAKLGKAIYDYELKRPRKYKPDLRRYQLSYR